MLILAAQLSVGKKILLGFAAVLLILAVVGFIGVQALDESSEGFKSYRALARDTNLVGRVQANLLMQKVSAEEFIFSGSEDANEKYYFFAQRVEGFLARAQVEIQKPDRAELVDRFEENYGAFTRLFTEIQGLIAQRNALVFDRLDVVGPRMRRSLTEIMESAFRDEDAAAAYYAGVSMQDMMLGRFYMTKFLVDNRIEDFERSMSEFDNLQRDLSILDRELQNPIRRELLGQVQSLKDQYVETAARVRDIILTRNRTIEEKFFPVGDALSDDIEQVKLSVMADQDELGPRLQASNGLAVVNMKVVGAVAGLIGLFLAVFIGRRISGPIVVTTKAAQSIADGDLDIILDARGGDEVAVLQKSIMSMAASLKRTLDEVRDKERIAQKKSVQAEESATRANAAMEDAESKRDSMLHTASELDKVVQAVNEITTQLSDYVDQAAGGAENQRERSTETATAMEEMNATVLEVAQNSSATAEQAATSKEKAEEGAKMVENVIAAMGEVSNQSDTLKTKMADLQGQAKSIGSIMTVITDIADQTNLLALNAAIEAARAGEAGRGFAVVADEVRKLAEKTMQATQEVEKAITGIQSVAEENVRNVDTAVASVGKATGLASQSGDALNEILHLSETSTDQIRGIATAAEQQSAASDEINRSVADIDRISQETASVMVQSREVVHSLEAQMNVLRELMSGLTKP